MIKIKSFYDHLTDRLDEDYAEAIRSVVGDVNIINAKLLNAMGIATVGKIYVDLEKALRAGGEEGLAFIIFHEFTHYCRIETMGKEWYFDNMLNSDFESYLRHNKFEEELADRWATHKVNKLFGTKYNDLNDRDYNSMKFEQTSKTMHTTITETFKTGEELVTGVEQFVHHVRQ